MEEDIKVILDKVRLSGDIELVTKTQLFYVFKKKVELFNGEKTYFEYLVRKPTVNVIAITHENKFVVLHQNQPGNFNFIDFPGGSLDSYKEDELEAIKRELLEETGMISDNITEFKKVRVNDVILWDHTIFIAKNCKKINEQNLDLGEKIQVELRDIDDIFEVVNLSNFRDINAKSEINSYLISQEKKEDFLNYLKY